MKKQQIKVKVDFDFNWTYGVDIKQLRSDLDALEKLGVESVDIQVEERWGNPSILICAYVSRLETNEEFRARIAANKEVIERQKARELRELERLQSKYGKQ